MARKKTPSRNPSAAGPRRKIRYAVVGLGYISQVAVLPAFRNARRNSELVALVSDDPLKQKELAKRYRVPQTHSYEAYGDLLASGDIDAVYIALPNHMHRAYAVAAAEAGVHVLCEKPLAVNEKECEDMIRAAEEHDVRLMTAYRLHFEKANLKSVEIVRSGRLGEPRVFHSIFTMQVEEGNIRLGGPDLGGGPLYDIGIYCINAARYLFRAEPSEVFAASANIGEKRFQESQEMASAILRFPVERLASFACSFGASDTGWYQVMGTKGDLRLDSAYGYAEAMKQTVTVDGKSRQTSFPKRDQFAPELLYFSDCILKGKDPEPSGREGLADVRIIRALLRSIETGRSVKLPEFERGKRPTMAMEIERPAIPSPPLVHVESPSGD
ncbi:MAG TPA: Gfo/Idh/MocA family oxidoreductase [Thermoanaerobaculia bacterium]